MRSMPVTYVPLDATRRTELTAEGSCPCAVSAQAETDQARLIRGDVGVGHDVEVWCELPLRHEGWHEGLHDAFGMGRWGPSVGSPIPTKPLIQGKMYFPSRGRGSGAERGHAGPHHVPEVRGLPRVGSVWHHRKSGKIVTVTGSVTLQDDVPGGHGPRDGQTWVLYDCGGRAFTRDPAAFRERFTCFACDGSGCSRCAP